MALLCACALSLAAATPAHAGAILAPEDSAELANALAEATEVQDVCYGWVVALDDAGTAREDVGSSFGPDRRIDPADARCAKGVVELFASITYTSELSEAEDSARFTVEATPFDAGRLERGLRDLGFGDGDLLSDRDDEAIVNLAGALPALVPDVSDVPDVPFEPAGAAPAQGSPTGKPGSDLLREQGWTLGLGAVFVVLGLAWWLYARNPARLRTGGPSSTTSTPAD